jgi:hypothetical protein
MRSSRNAPILKQELSTGFYKKNISSQPTTTYHVTENRLNSKVKVKRNFTLERAMKTQRASRVTALLFFNPGVKYRWAVNANPRPFYPQ